MVRQIVFHSFALLRRHLPPGEEFSGLFRDVPADCSSYLSDKAWRLEALSKIMRGSILPGLSALDHDGIRVRVVPENRL